MANLPVTCSYLVWSWKCFHWATSSAVSRSKEEEVLSLLVQTIRSRFFLKKDLIWAFTRLMNSSSFWARWAFLYPLVVVRLLVVTDCVPKPHPPLPTGAERRGWSNWCWALGIGFRWQGSSESTALCRIDERLFWSRWEGLHGVQVPPLSAFALYFYSMPYSTSSLTGCKSPVTCSSSTGKGKGAPKKPKDLSKRHHLFKKHYQ